MAPSLNSMAQVQQKANGALFTPDTLREWLTKRGLQSAFSKHLPLHGGTWWAPGVPSARPNSTIRVSHSGRGRRPCARHGVWVPRSPRELGPDHDGHVVDPRDKTGLFSWLTDKYGLLAELNEELGRSRTHARVAGHGHQVRGPFGPVWTIADSRGAVGRCAKHREASKEEERVLEEDPFYGHERAASEALANLGLALRVRGNVTDDE